MSTIPPQSIDLNVSIYEHLMDNLGCKKVSLEDGEILLKLLDLEFDIHCEFIPYLIKFLAPSKLIIEGIKSTVEFTRGYGWVINYDEKNRRLSITYVKGGCISFGRVLHVEHTNLTRGYDV